MRAGSVRPARLTRAIGSALSSRRIVAFGVRRTTVSFLQHLARLGDVVAHAEPAQQLRRADLDPEEMPVGRRMAVRGRDRVAVAAQLHRVVAGDVLEAVARAGHVQQQVGVVGRARPKRSCLRSVKSFASVAKRVGPSRRAAASR